MADARKFIYQIKQGKEGNRKIIIHGLRHMWGVEGNELADHLAKDSTKEEEDKNVKIPRNDIKNMAKNIAWEHTTETVKKESEVKGKIYFQKFFREERDTWFKDIKEERGFISFINRLRANHYNLNESLERKDFYRFG